MKKENYKIKTITNINDMNFFLDFCTKNYGKIIDISLPEINVKIVKDIQYLVDQMPNISTIKITIISDNREAISIIINTKNWEMEVKRVDMKEQRIEQNQPLKIKQTLEEALSNPNYIYFRFDNGLIAKYDNKGIYYRLDEKNEWVRDPNILSRIVGSEYDYEILNHNSDKGINRK